MRLSATAFAFLLVLGPRPAAGDTVHLADGTDIEGEVLDLGDVVRIRRGPASITVSKDRVLRITFAPSFESQYAARAAELRPDDAEGHAGLAEWCKARGLSAHARAEYEAAVAADPDHAAARRGLGHERVGDRWLPFEEAQRERGLVLHRGEWVSPEERDLRVALEHREEMRRAAEAEVRRLLRRSGASDPAVREEIRRKLDAFEPAERLDPCLDALGHPDPDVRVLACEQLGVAGNAKAVVPLARRFVLDEAKTVRVEAGRALVALDAPGTGGAFLSLFVSGNAPAQRRAAEGLAAYPDRRAVPALADALERALREPPEISLLYAGPGMCAPGGPLVVSGTTVILPPGQAPPPPAALPAGAVPGALPRPRVLAIPRVVTSIRQREDPAVTAAREAYKDAVLDALRACTGEDFGERPDRWRAWWARQAEADAQR
jgi:HEAT repeat protein